MCVCVSLCVCAAVQAGLRDIWHGGKDAGYQGAQSGEDASEPSEGQPD